MSLAETIQRNTQLEVTYSHDDYRQAALTLWGQAGAYIVDEYRRINIALFDSELPPLPMVIGITAYGKCIGLTRGGGSWAVGDLPRITIASNWFKSGRHSVSDTIVHEMVHAKLMMRGECADHNARPWCREISRLSPLVLGHEIAAEPVRPRRVEGRVVRLAHEGQIARKDLARWPHSLRAADWDRGEPIRVETY